MMDTDQNQSENDIVGQLIRHAGRRENPSPEEYERVLAAASAALERKLRKRRWRFMTSGIAAIIVVGVLIALIIQNLPTPAAQPIAELNRTVGPAKITNTDTSSWEPLTRENTVLFAGTRIRTGPASRLGVVMENGVSLRLAEATEVLFTAPGHIKLVRGKVYADAGKDAGKARRIVIETGAGSTWDLGTQFEVAYTDDIYRLRVREGLVILKQEHREVENQAGQQLTVDASRNIQRDLISKNNEDWLWTETVAPDPVIDTRPVSVLLEWVSRQTGRDIAFADPKLELKAETTLLFGSVHFIEPLEALRVMLATTDFDYTLQEDGTIFIDSK